MFNRKIEARIVKDKKTQVPPAKEDPEVIPVKFVYASSALDRLANQIAKGVIVYMFMDTFRQVMVERAKRL